jgi:hypothetical protein
MFFPIGFLAMGGTVVRFVAFATVEVVRCITHGTAVLLCVVSIFGHSNWSAFKLVLCSVPVQKIGGWIAAAAVIVSLDPSIAFTID